MRPTSSPARSLRAPRPAGQRGEGPTSMLVGAAVFLTFVLFAAQVSVHLYATSTVTAAAFDLARLASGSRGLAPGEAQAHTADLLGDYAAELTTLDVERDGQQVVVTLAGPSPARLVRGLGGVAGLSTIRRQVRLRVEEPVGAPRGAEP